MIAVLKAAVRQGFRGVIGLRFPVLLSALLLSPAAALAQFSVDGGSRDHPARDMDRGRGGHDGATGVGIGIGIGLGRALIEEAARDNAKGGGTGEATSQRSHRAARKGGGDKPGGAKGQNKDDKKTDAPPTLFPKDPADGIDVPGGKVHRGTGTVTGYNGGPRPGIYCWVHLTDKSKCEKTAQYQFVTVNIESKWGSEAKANINDLVKKVRANHGKKLPTTPTGVSAIPGQVRGDDYNTTRNDDPVNLTGDDGKNVKTPEGGDITAGAYIPQKIPGAGGDTGEIDAPYWSETIGAMSGELVPDSLKKPKNSPTQPPPSDAGEITVLLHFRTYVYCVKPKRVCLGYFEWDYNETITVEMKWREATSKDLADSMFGGNMDSGGTGKKGKNQPAEQQDKTWVPYFGAKGAAKVDGPTIGEWKPCP